MDSVLEHSSYSKIVSSGQRNVYVRLLTIWRGSLYKLIMADLAVYVILFYLINFIYRFALNKEYQRSFERVVTFSENVRGTYPLSFLLGFFVTGVIDRWWQMYMSIPWLNRIAFLVQGTILGEDIEKAQRIRVSILRYINLSWIILMRKISDQIAIRFREAREEEEAAKAKEDEEDPAEDFESELDMNHDLPKKKDEEVFVREILLNINSDKKVKSTFRKLITESEIRAFEAIAAEHYTKHKTCYDPEYWIPMQWASRLAHKAYLHGYITDPRTLVLVVDEIDNLRGQMQKLQIFSSIMTPLVYCQVVIIAVHSYFLCLLFSSQFVDPEQKVKGREVDMYIPVFTILQFMFICGWLKVAMCVMNPFGDDDEDFQTSNMLDYNLDVSYRSGKADPCLYPEFLVPSQPRNKPQPGSEVDKLDEFLEDVETDLQDVQPPDEMQDMTGLEMTPSVLERVREFFRGRQTTKKKKKRNSQKVHRRDTRTTWRGRTGTFASEDEACETCNSKGFRGFNGPCPMHTPPMSRANLSFVDCSSQHGSLEA